MSSRGYLRPLSAENPAWTLSALEPRASQVERAVITVAVHGNEPCGVMVHTHFHEDLLSHGAPCTAA